MRLKQIALQGYKTFATKTVFSFEEGITAVVGPNGSGKSNIADALRWVLGEQSYRTLRGQRSTDMIFAGSHGRPRAGMAQAILTLDNSDGWLPIDYTEVEIGRRVYRSGENEYLLNGQKVRLRDVQELLSSSGLAERTYTIIGQGLIDQALSLRSDERRALFEEAAGISHYKARRAETLRRLEETRHNLERVHDILSEINPRLNTLRRQANRARNHEQVEADLRHLLRIWYGYQWEQTRLRVRRRRQEAQDAEAGWKKSRQALLEAQQKIDELRRAVNGLQRQIQERQTARERVREQREQVERRVAVLSERRSLLARQVAEITDDLPPLKAQEAQAQAELAEATTALEAAQESLLRLESELRQFNLSFEVQQAEIDNTIATEERLASEFREAQTRLAQAEGKLGQLRERRQERSADQDYNEEFAELAKQIASLERVVNSAKERVQSQHNQRQALQEQAQTVGKSLRTLRREAGEREKAVNAAVKQLTRLEARVEMLDALRHRELPQNDLKSLGRVAGFVTIPAEHRHAIGSALGARLGALVLSDEASLWQLASSGNEKQAYVALVHSGKESSIASSNAPGDGSVWAIDVVEIADGYRFLAPLLFGGVLLVKDRRQAYAFADQLPAGSVAVAPDGFMVHPGGIVEYNPQESEQSILAREEAWRQAAAEVEAAQERLRALQAELQTVQAHIKAEQQKLDELNREERRLARLEAEANERVEKASRQLDRSRQQESFLHRTEESRVRELERLDERISETQKLLVAQRERAERLEAEWRAAQARLEALPIAEAEQERRSRQQRIDSARTILSGRQAVVESRRATLHQIQRQLTRQEGRREELLARQRELALNDEQSRLTELRTEIEQLDQALLPLREQFEQRSGQLEQAEDTLARQQKLTHDLETAFTQAKVAFSQQESQLEGLGDRIRADLGLVALRYDEDHPGQSPLPIAEVVEQLPDVKELPEDIEESIQRYRGQLHRMGAINPDAPAEYEETRERSEFLTQQVEDLNRTEEHLRRVIAELDDLTSQAFARTVEEVDTIFGTMFNRLFGGGSAQLVLTDPDDLTVTGVEILARLPRRRQQGLGLLSGGERSLTAAALIFALLNVNPPPFCVMDEVDAMLDEANVARFRDALGDLADQTQVIVITHNRGTVQAAKAVYGISMHSDSTSQVISVRPEDYLNGQKEVG